MKNKSLDIKEKPDAIILAGGTKGKVRLFPKALLEYEGRSIIEHQIEWLKPFVNKIIIACHEKECSEISKILKDFENIEFSKEKQLLGTAAAVKKALEKTGAKNI
ncbi:MAG: NTP transferase domain-containing protein, partial [Candidatus Pacearchaeota archaeon]